MKWLQNFSNSLGEHADRQTKDAAEAAARAASMTHWERLWWMVVLSVQMLLAFCALLSLINIVVAFGLAIGGFGWGRVGWAFLYTAGLWGGFYVSLRILRTKPSA